MAYIKIFTIKDNVNRSIDYILNENKTNPDLIYFNKCGIYNTEQDFELTRLQFNSKVKVKSRHLIQSFSKEENVTQKKVLKIAKEFAKKHLKDYQYIISVHTDKDNLHAHIIFNTVNLKDGKAYRSNKFTFHSKLLKDFNEVLEKNNIEKATVGESNKKNEYKEKINLRNLLKKDIDLAIQKSKTYTEFIKLMKTKYEIKDSGKYLSFKHKNFSKRFIRCNSKLGDDYTREKIKERIKSNLEYAIINLEQNKEKKEHKNDEKYYKGFKMDLTDEFEEIRKNIGFIINTNKNVKARTKQGYRNWAIKNNIKTIHNNRLILSKKYNIRFDHEENIKKKINEYKIKLQTISNKEDIIKLKLDLFELNSLLRNFETYRVKDNYSEIER